MPSSGLLTTSASKAIIVPRTGIIYSWHRLCVSHCTVTVPVVLAELAPIPTPYSNINRIVLCLD
ncbi:hypothetical protein J6590_021445 [Homalodisca vitripennis]|nr:hypothetical protein J6590_021445 [Homalodisca vitripennis]